MGQLSVTIVTSFILFLTYYLFVFSVLAKASAVPATGSRSSSGPGSRGALSSTLENSRSNRRLTLPLIYTRNARSPFSNSMTSGHVGPVSHPKVPVEMEFLLDDDEFYDKSKRYDDYGHMRFGKRGEDQFDDYGHMRFGKRGE